MTTPFWKLLHAFTGSEAGRDCRSCGQSVQPGDDLGMSEGVCQACRLAADR